MASPTSVRQAGTTAAEATSLESRLRSAEARLSSLQRQFGELRDRLLTLEAERKQTQVELENQRLRDPYTGFPNRRQFAASHPSTHMDSTHDGRAGSLQWIGDVHSTHIPSLARQTSVSKHWPRQGGPASKPPS